MHPEYVEIANKQNARDAKYCTRPTLGEEMNVPDLGLAWIWYIIIMAVSFIFTDRLFIWVIASVIFFNYRKKKLREAGYKLWEDDTKRK